MAEQVFPRKGAFDGLIMPPPAGASTSAESSSGMKSLPYDVFINHHGGDTKRTVANSIYKKLDATGLRIFLDKNALELGDFFPKALEEAMDSASLHIAIFSENYAYSPWCLEELVFMLKLANIKLIPIFYHLEPSTLRWAITPYAEAFSEHEIKRRYTSEQLQSWKWALHRASFYHGETINNQDEEEKAVTNVVNRVLKELKKERLDVAKYPVGLDEAEQDFHNIALQFAGPIQIVGIWGMGGAGKTTLAKRLYNKKCSTIHRSSFIFDVREAARKGLLHEKQKKLLENLDFKGERAFDNVDEGKEILKSRLRDVSVLIVIDDVDHTDQLDALLPARERLGHGSLIIVTTRELRVLKAWGISTIYKIRALNLFHSEQLFCWHAFGQPSPFLGFEDLAKSFINACHGLPLSLKVVGGLLCGESSEEYWQSQFDNLSREVPDDIKSSLKLSYDCLNKEEKEMFLDIACFFIGRTSGRVIAVWDGSGWNGPHGWQRLVNKCLVELDDDNLIRMHDHLRDWGREIANQQSPYRLWSKSQIIEIQPLQEVVRIRGMADAFGDNCYPRQGEIIIYTNQGQRSLLPSSLGLKIFIGNGDFINEERSELSGELVCLECDGFQYINLPSWLPFKKLRILELSSPERLEDLWECDADAPLQLRELVIDEFRSFQGFPRSIAHLKNLKKISVSACLTSDDTLNSLPEEFCNLQSLEHLEIKYCKNLSYLPSNFGKLTNLKHLDLTLCSTLKMLPDSCKKLTLLEYLDLSYCYELTIKSELHILENMTKLGYLSLEKCRNSEELRLPEAASLTKLGYLNLRGCKKLEELRLPVAASLTKLNLGETRLKDLPANIGQLTKLTELVIGSEFLTTLPTCLGNLSCLTTLEIQGCEKLESLPDSLEHLNFLRDLSISKSGVKCLPISFIHLQSLQISWTPISELSYGPGCTLRTIKLWGTKVSKISICGDCCPFLETLELSSNMDLRELEILPATLKSLDVSYCHVLKDIRGVCGLKNLKNLSITSCEEVDGLPCFAESASLEKLKLKGSSKVKKIAGLQELRSLRELSIELDEFPSLATSLRKINLQKCNNWKKIERLDHLRLLEELEISNCPELDGLPSLAELTSLKEFELRKCHKLKKIEGLESLQSLVKLKISDCQELVGLPRLAKLISLENFELEKCHKLEKIEGLESLSSLKRLRIYDCPELDAISSLAELTSLKTIRLEKCNRLEKLEGLERLSSLEMLELDYCPALDGLPSLAELNSLKGFNLRKCHKVEKMEGVESLISLERLTIGNCAEITGLPSLAKLTSLKKFQLIEFYKLEKMESLGSLRSLKMLEISDCPELDGLPSLAELTSLENFELGKCHKLEKIEGLGSLPSLKTLKIIDCPELDGLPSLAELTSLNKFELLQCHKLQKIEGLDSLRSLKTLKISDCQKLDELPSLAKLISLQNFELRKWHKLEKIEGLERLRLLKNLEVHVRSNAPCIIGLEHCERLKSLVVVANDIPVVEPFISNIQKWPRKVIVCTRAVIDVGSLKTFFTSFPQHLDESGIFRGLNWSRPESSAKANSILICFIIDDVYPELLIQIFAHRYNCFVTELANGMWVWMGVFPQGSDWLQSNWYEIRASIEGKCVKVKEAWFAMGEEGSILEVFNQLSLRQQILGANSIL